MLKVLGINRYHIKTATISIVENSNAWRAGKSEDLTPKTTQNGNKERRVIVIAASFWIYICVCGFFKINKFPFNCLSEIVLPYMCSSTT